MDKFIEWMKYKEYCSVTRLSKQSLIGYMLEYLIERYDGLASVDVCMGKTIESFYDSLAKNIEELNK